MTKPYHHRDKYFKKAKQEGHRARSYFKLEEIDARAGLIRPGMHVLDLGAAPGSFMQYAAKKAGTSGLVVGIDLTPIAPVGGPAPTLTYAGDIFAEETRSWLLEKHPGLFDVLVSDLAPKTTGVKDVDHWASIELSYQVLSYAAQHLKPGGACLMKVFGGEDFDRLLHVTKRRFDRVRVMKPDATRDRSREVYLVCLGFRPRKKKETSSEDRDRTSQA